MLLLGWPLPVIGRAPFRRCRPSRPVPENMDILLALRPAIMQLRRAERSLVLWEGGAKPFLGPPNSAAPAQMAAWRMAARASPHCSSPVSVNCTRKG